MNLITAVMPTIRVWIFGAVVGLLARAGLPTEHAAPVADWITRGLPLLGGIA